MTRKEFTDRVTMLVNAYLSNPSGFGSDPQIKVIPVTMMATIADSREMLDSIEYSNEAIEDGTGADGAMDQESTDRQAARNPDFYPVRTLITATSGGGHEADTAAIAAIADTYGLS